jgi:hypothetical protein
VTMGAQSRWDGAADMSHLLRTLWWHGEGQDIVPYYSVSAAAGA